MNNFFLDGHKRITKLNNLSKNDIAKNIRTVYTPIIEKPHKNKKYDKKYFNLGKKNLTFTNIYNYNYNHLDISDRKIKDPLLGLKKGFFYESQYSSFFTKSPNKKKSRILITGLNSTKENSLEKGYTKIIDNSSVNRSKSSSKNINNNLSLKKNIKLYSGISFKPLIHFNRDSFDIPLYVKRENLSNFMEKCRIIRREKFRNRILDNKAFSLAETKSEELKIVKIAKDEYFKNKELFNKFSKSLDKYLRYLEMKINKEMHDNEDLNTKRKKLMKDVYRLNEKINNFKIEISKFKNIKKIINKYKKEDKSIFLTSSQIINAKENKISLNNSITKDKKKLHKKASNESKNNNSSTVNDNNFKKEENVKIRKCNSTGVSNIRKEKEDFKLKNILLNLENNLLNKIHIYNQKENEIIELKKKLLQSKSFAEGEYYYNKTKISAKYMKLFFLKNENLELKDIFYTIKKNSTFNKNIEKKVYNILINLNKEINIEKIFSIYNLSVLLKLESKEFYDKMKKVKLIYMLKIIELVWTFLFNLQSNYLNNPQLKIKYENVLDILEKERNMRMIKIKKKELKKNLEEKKLHFFKKSTKIRFFSYRRFDIKNTKNNKRHFSKQNINNKNDSKIDYENLLTYW